MRDYADQITWIVVADGEKALFFRNNDIDTQPDFEVLDKEKLDNPPTREQAANRRGRMNDNGVQQRSALDDTDWHEFEKERFAKDVAEMINKPALKNAYDRLVLFAPPKVLGEIRPELHKEAQKRLVQEVGSDLTNHPVEKIEAKYAELFTGAEPDYDADLRNHG